MQIRICESMTKLVDFLLDRVIEKDAEALFG
jgi:hypothetical protein